MKLTKEQQKIIRLANVADNGELGILGEINDLEDRIDTISKVLDGAITELRDRVSSVRDGIDGKQGPMGLQGLQGPAGRDGRDGLNGLNGLNAPEMSGLMIVDKINDLPIESDYQIDAKHIKNLPKHEYARGLTITQSGGSSFEIPTGTVNGSNTSYTFATAHSVIVVDGAPLQATDQNGDVNWTGTTTITLTNAPTRSIFGL